MKAKLTFTNPLADSLLRQGKKPVTLRLDPDIVDWFQRKGGGYQTRINGILRDVAKWEMQNEMPEAVNIFDKPYPSKRRPPKDVEMTEQERHGRWAPLVLRSAKVGVTMAAKEFGLSRQRVYEIIRAWNTEHTGNPKGVRNTPKPRLSRLKVWRSLRGSARM